jgi:hypothetical protein
MHGNILIFIAQKEPILPFIKNIDRITKALYKTSSTLLLLFIFIKKRGLNKKFKSSSFLKISDPI